jgi:hypothetical protein
MVGSGLAALVAMRCGALLDLDRQVMFELWIWTISGPFAEYYGTIDYSALRIVVLSLLNLGAIFAYPLHPKTWAAWTSGAAVLLWFIQGFAHVYAGV